MFWLGSKLHVIRCILRQRLGTECIRKRAFVRTLCSFQVFEGKTVRIIQPFFVVISWDTFNVTGSRDQGLNPHSSVNKSVATMFVECGKICPPFEYS